MPKRPLTAAERASTKKTEKKKGEKKVKKEPEPLTMPSLPSCHPSQEALAKRMKGLKDREMFLSDPW